MHKESANPLIKNKCYDIEITGMTAEGNGVGRAEGVAVFVPMTAIGDKLRVKIVKLNKSYAYGIIDALTEASPDRIQVDCPVYKTCGGCVFRHISYEAEVRIKDGFVRDAFTRIGGLSPEFEPELPCESPDRYRNKAQYPVARGDNGSICGFFSRRSHRVVECSDCLLQPLLSGELASEVTRTADSLGIPPYNEKTGSGVLRHVYIRNAMRTGELMLCIVVSGYDKRLDALFERVLAEHPEITSAILNINPKQTNVILGNEYRTIAGSPIITDILCGNRIELSPSAFYQVNTAQAERLYAIAAEYAGDMSGGLLLDMYCGAGTIGLSMAHLCSELIGVEIVPEAVDNAARNANASGITNARFICGDAGTVARKLADEHTAPDVIILDPPRKGCDSATISAAAQMNPRRIIMISCNPSTAARDCLEFAARGYATQRVRAVDMFPRTGHVETVVLMSRKTP